jgi:hypothetical protein
MTMPRKTSLKVKLTLIADRLRDGRELSLHTQSDHYVTLAIAVAQVWMQKMVSKWKHVSLKLPQRLNIHL